MNAASNRGRHPRPRLRELRQAVGWTQQKLAENLIHIAWTRGDTHAGVNADMVAKWERGEKGISARYRILLCHLFGVTEAQLGLATQAHPAVEPAPVRNPESLLSLVDDAAALLDQLGAAGSALAPHLLAGHPRSSRRAVLDMLDADDPAGHARLATATVDDFEQLAGRYAQLYDTVDPAALSHTVTAHVRAAMQSLRRNHGQDDRRRLLRNLARVATLAGRLAFEDLGDHTAARAHLALAIDCAREAGDDHAAATALGHAAHLALTEGQPAAVLAHIAAAQSHADHTPELRPWLDALAVIAHADRGDLDTARATLDTTSGPTDDDHSGNEPGPASPDLTAARAHAQLRVAGHHAREHLANALDRLPAGARRARVLVSLDLATAELDAGDLRTACRHATTAAGLLAHTPYVLGAGRLRAFREAAAAQRAEPKILRVLDEYLARAAA